MRCSRQQTGNVTTQHSHTTALPYTLAWYAIVRTYIRTRLLWEGSEAGSTNHCTLMEQCTCMHSDRQWLKFNVTRIADMCAYVCTYVTYKLNAFSPHLRSGIYVRTWLCEDVSTLCSFSSVHVSDACKPQKACVK